MSATKYPCDEMSVRRNVRATKCPCDEMSATKCPCDEMSVYHHKGAAVLFDLPFLCTEQLNASIPIPYENTHRKSHINLQKTPQKPTCGIIHRLKVIPIPIPDGNTHRFPLPLQLSYTLCTPYKENYERMKCNNKHICIL